MKKLLSLMLAATMLAPLGTVGAAAYDDEDYELTPGGFNEHGKYTKSHDKIVTQHLMFAMPDAWQNEITRDPRCNGAAGMYWWMGWDNPEDNLSHGWPGYTCDKVEEEGVDNLYAIDVPNFGNGEKGNGTMIIWNNNIDGGRETDPQKNPFYAAAKQTGDFQAGYYSRYDQNDKYEPLFRYIYKYNLEKLGVAGAAGLKLDSKTFWKDINRVSAQYLGQDYDALDYEEKNYLVDCVMDVNDLDFSVFGEYASNFFNSDTIQEQYRDLYPEEEDGDSCISFHFDNMVFVVDFSPEHMEPFPISGKIGFSGDFYFYYGGGAYGTWPTKELNEEMGGESGNFTTDYSPQPESKKIYFNAETSGWKNFKTVTCFLYNHSTGEQVITWGSKKGNMTDEGNGIWSFDLAEKGYSLLPECDYGVIFTADWNLQTTDLIIDANNIGDTAYCTGEKEGSYSNPDRATRIVRWCSDMNGRPVTIDSLGKVTGDSYWSGETAYSLMVDFLKNRIDTTVALTHNAPDQIISDLANQLGLSREEVARAVQESGREFDIDPPTPYPATSDEPVSGKIYFDAKTTGWNYKTITCYPVNQTMEKPLITWGSKKGNMTDEGNGIWSFDLAEKGCALSPSDNYDVIFTADWTMHTCELIIDGDNIGDTAYCTGETVENTSDQTKQDRVVKWCSGRNGNPITITAGGHVIGDTYRRGENAYSVLVKHLNKVAHPGLIGESYELDIYRIGAELGLSDDEIARALRESELETDVILSDGKVVTGNGMVFFRQENNTLTLIDYTGSDAALSIPNTLKCMVQTNYPTASGVGSYERLPITAIGAWAFANNKTLKRVDIPDSVTSVGKGAFYNCVGLQSIILPDSVTSLGANAFEKCLYLESAVLGDGITAISDETFFDCRRLTAVNIPDSVSTIGAEAFYNCRSLREAALPNGVHSIGSADNSGRVGVFEECRSLEKLLVPDSITSIEPNAFDNCIKLSVYGSKASYAESFAASEGIAFKNIGNVTASAKIIGDFNCDLELTVTDATDLQRFLAEMLGEEAPDLTNPKVLAYLDVNGDGAVTISDVTMVQQFLAEMITSFR